MIGIVAEEQTTSDSSEISESDWEYTRYLIPERKYQICLFKQAGHRRFSVDMPDYTNLVDWCISVVEGYCSL